MGFSRGLPLALALGCGGVTLSAATLVQGPGFRLTTDDVEAELNFRPEPMARAIRSDPDQLRRLIDDLYRREALAHEGESLPKDQRDRYRLERARKEALVAIALDHARSRILAHLPDFTDRARELYQAKREAYWIPEQIRVRHILLRARTPEEKAHRREEAQAILNQLRQGASFAQLAEERSEDPGTAAGGGDLGFFTRGKMVPAFERAAFSLKEPGEISGIVETPFGLHILRLEERIPGRQRTFEEVKASLLTKLRREYVRDRLEAWRRRIVDPAKADIARGALDAYVRDTVEEARGE